jgi:hypothetical protein
MKLPALKEIVDERKEKAIENLSESYAKNNLPLEEYERLVEYINKIESERELVLVEKMVAEFEPGSVPEESDDDEDELDDYQQYGHVQNGNLTVLSTRSFSGPVKSGSQFVSILGSGQIKIRKVDLSKKRTNLHVLSILGDTEIYVEPGIQVTNKVVPILGNSSTNLKVQRQAKAGEPEIVLRGAALFGNISVKLLKE